jgi:hypothetical protein
MKRSMYWILACFVLISVSARSQNEGVKAAANPLPVQNALMNSRGPEDLAMIQDNSTTGGSTTPESLFTRPDGIYLEPGWAAGRVMLNDNVVLDNLLLRYDLYHQQIQFVRGNDTLAFSKPEEVKCFVLDGRNFIFTGYQNNGALAKGFFEILSDGDCKLLLRRTIKYHLNSETGQNLEDDVFVRECEYFIMKKDNMAKPVRSCKKSVLCAFHDKEDQIRAYMDDNNLKMNSCDQLKQVVAYYNSIP